jgi:ABC-type multidrug transport system fused ATPase/permease subunit
MISHRVGATKFADRILVFEKGKIVEDGNHDKLMNARGCIGICIDRNQDCIRRDNV